MADYYRNNLKIHCSDLNVMKFIKNAMFKTVLPKDNKQTLVSVEQYKEYHPDKDIPQRFFDYQYRHLFMDMNLLLPYPEQINEGDSFMHNGTNLSGFNNSAWHSAVWGTKWNVCEVGINKYTETDIELSYETANGNGAEYIKALIRYAFAIDIWDKKDFSLEYLYSMWEWNAGGKIFTDIDEVTKRSGYTHTHYDSYLEFLQYNNPEGYVQHLEFIEKMKTLNK